MAQGSTGSAKDGAGQTLTDAHGEADGQDQADQGQQAGGQRRTPSWGLVAEELGHPGGSRAVEAGADGWPGRGGGGPQRPRQWGAADPIDGDPVGGQLGVLQPAAGPPADQRQPEQHVGGGPGG